MVRRLALHDDLLMFLDNVYYQPPSNIQMKYPCMIYTKTKRMRHFADDVIYLSQQEYSITVIDRNPDSDVANRIERHFQSCVISQYYTVDSLHHTTLKLYY